MSEDETLIDFRGVKIVPEEAKLLKEIEEDFGWELDINSQDKDDKADFVVNKGHLVKIFLWEKKFRTKHTLVFRFPKIQVIHLTYVEIPEIPVEANDLLYLKELYLYDSNLKSIHADFDKLTKLFKVSIIEGEIDRVPLLPPQLEELNLINLGINNFPIELKRCENLKKLDLSKNKIEFIPKWFKQTKDCLKYLYMSDSYIGGIPEWFSEFHQLKHLIFRNAPIKTICDLSQIKNLSMFNVKGSKLTEFPSSLATLTKLISLRIGVQGFPKVPDIFDNKPDLEYLLLNGFDLNEFPNSIAKCKTLEVLNLDNCKMESAKPQLRGLRNLKNLSLVGCNLKTLFDGIFITKKEIDIRNNQIEKMPDKWLKYAERLITNETTWKNPKRPLDLSDDDYLIMLAAKKKILKPASDGKRLMGRTLTNVREDIEIEFSDENILAEGDDPVYPDEIMGLQHLPDGRPFIGLHVGGDWEYPIYVVVFVVNDEIYAFVPEHSNTFNELNNSAYGNDDELDNRAIDKIIKKMGKTELLDKQLGDKLDVLDYSVDVDTILNEIKSYMDYLS